MTTTVAIALLSAPVIVPVSRRDKRERHCDMECQRSGYTLSVCHCCSKQEYCYPNESSGRVVSLFQSPLMGGIAPPRCVTLRWSDKFCAIVEKDNDLIFDMHQHIKAAITIDILKRQCDWYKVLPISHEGRAGVTQGLGYITPRNFDNENVAAEV